MKKKNGIVKSKKKLTAIVVTSLLVLVAALGFLMPNNMNRILTGVRNVFAAGDKPVINKGRTDNGDGTYKLSLSVKGDSEKKPQKANVIVIVDTSSSMNQQTGNSETTYTETDSTGGWNYQNNLYGLVGDNYVQLTRTTTGNWPNITYHFWYNGTEYTGQRYTRQVANQTRLDAAKSAVNDLADALMSHNGQDGNPNDTIQMALVDFANMASTIQGPTNNKTTMLNAIDSLSAGTGTSGRGTNWEAGLRHANNSINFGDDDPTYVIFVSDGNPTYYMTSATGSTTNNNNRSGSGSEQDGNNVQTSYNHALPAAQALATKYGASNFYTIGAYGNVTRMENLTTGAGAPSSNYYAASDTAALQEALNDILNKIEMAGIGQAVINDGTTNQVSTDSGIVELLEVDENSYQYYKNGEPWTDEDDPAPPEARLENGHVIWDLSDLGVLENDVTYTVTFDVYPSQTTYDYIADLENGTIEYSDLPQKVRDYLHQNGTLGNFTYTLETNTTATLSYVDTRISNETQTEKFENPPAVGTEADTISIKKTFNNELDPSSHGATEVNVNLNRDGEEFYDVVLNSGNNWSKNPIYIATGLARLDKEAGVFTVLDEGHDYSFSELGAEAYNWELHTETVHPMLINGELKELIMLEEDDDQPDMGSANYKEVDGTEYVKLANGKIYKIASTSPEISAVNERRSRLNITKAVDAIGQSANPDDTFKFTIKVTQKDEENKAIVDDPETNDDDLWFSVYKGGYVDLGSRLESSAWTKYVNENGETYYYAPNGTELVVNLKAGENLRFVNLISNTDFSVVEGDLDNYVLDSITSNDDKKDIDEDKKSIDGHIGDTGTNYTVTYKNKYEKVDVPVKKVWTNDDNGKEGLREEIDVQLFANGKKVEGDEGVGHLTSENTDNDGNWVYTFEDLDRYANGEQITYTVEELTDLTPHYTSATTGDMATGFTITNTRENDDIYTSVSGTKTWEDNNDQDGIRPEALEIFLYKNNGDEPIKSTVITENDDWSYEFTNLPKYENGDEITYTVTEKPVDFYEGSQGETEYDFINTHETFKTKVVVDKDWEDNNNQDGLRGPITVKLSNHGLAPETLQLTADNNWHVVWDNLDRRSSGTDIDYQVTEVVMPEGYEQDGDPTVSETVDQTTMAKTITIKFKNKHELQTRDIKVTKVWDDNNDQDGVRPTSISVTLKANGETADVEDATVTLNKDNNWTYTWKGLYTNSNASEIEYTVEEDESQLPNSYSLESIEGDMDKGFTITNTHELETRDIEVTKVWDDNDDQDGVRPGSISVTLKANGETADVDDATVTLNKDNNWTYTWKGLYTNASGKEIKYTVEEDESQLPETYSLKSIDGSMADGFTITNTHELEKRNIKVTKEWNDKNDQDGIRPSSVSVTLKANGETADVDDATVTLNADNSWTYTWKDVDTNSEGSEITYTVEEDTDALPSTYSLESITGSMAQGFVVKNKHVPDVTSVIVKKEWIDDLPDQYRPSSVEVTLKANGEVPANVSPTTVTLNEATNWTYTWTGLDKNSAGQKIKYTVTEKSVENYDTDYDVTEDDNQVNIVVINTIQDLKKDIPVTKVWSDDNNRDGMRPGNLSVTITGRVGTEVVDGATQTITLSGSGDTWNGTFTNLPIFHEGKLISYSIEEENVSGYSVVEESTNTSSESEGFKITNKHDPIKIKITGTKTWNDEENVDGARPESITINLLKNGSQFKSTKVKVDEETGNWTFEFDDLYKCENGSPIKYSITEEAVGGYSSTISDVNEDNTVTVINTHTPETISYKITKSWDDLDNNDGVRPASITVRLLADGTEIRSAVLNEGNGWSYTWTNLPKYKTGSVGVLVQYTIIEDEVKGYDANFTDIETTKETTSINNKITNKHTPEVHEDIKVTKTWADDNNKYGVRPEKITVRLLANGKEVKVCELTAANGWTYTFTGLLKYMNGELVVYTIVEDPVLNYETKIDGFDITNIYNGPHGEIVPPNTMVSGSALGTATNTNKGNNISVLFFLILGLIGLAFRKEANN